MELLNCIYLQSVIIMVWADCNDDPPMLFRTSYSVNGNQPYKEGTQILYNCSQGYRDRDVGFNVPFMCTQGQWLGQINCVDISIKTCYFDVQPTNGMVKFLYNEGSGPHYKKGTQLEFICNSGFKLTGRKYVMCTNNGTWETNLPSCQKVTHCSIFKGVENGIIKYETSLKNEIGSELSVRCSYNYILSGPTRVKCGSEGTWSSSPTCEQTACGNYPIGNSSCLQKTSLSKNNTELFITCMDGIGVSSTRRGPNRVKCNNNKWDNSMTMACHCDCKVVADDSKVKLFELNYKGYLQHGRTLVWDCKASLGRKSAHSITCLDGVMEMPKCTLHFVGIVCIVLVSLCVLVLLALCIKFRHDLTCFYKMRPYKNDSTSITNFKSETGNVSEAML